MFDEIKTLIEAQGKGFETFKGQLAELQDGLKAERKEREDLEARLNRGGLSTGNGTKAETRDQELKAIGSYVRSGDDMELKTMSVGSDPDGGYLVFPWVADQIRTKVRDQSPLASLSRHVSMPSGDAYVEPYDLTEAGAEWLGESDDPGNMETPTLGQLTVPMCELASLQLITRKLLDTTTYDLAAWLVGRIADRFARTQGAAFVKGDGIQKPKGVLSYDFVAQADSIRTDGALQYIASGGAGAWAASNPADRLVDLCYSLRAPYRKNAAWLMNSATAASVRKMKDSTGRFLWTDGLAMGQPATLLGYPVYLDEELPDVAADSISVLFGDFAQGYVVAEYPGIKLLRDPYTSKPHMKFFFYQRVGGAVADSDAIKGLKFSAS